MSLKGVGGCTGTFDLLSRGSDMDKHVLFVHGLRRANVKVWMSSGKTPRSVAALAGSRYREARDSGALNTS